MPRFRVVVADDNADLRAVLVDALERTDLFEVAGTASTGAEAEALARSTEPDLVLLDLDLPDMAGLDALHHIRTAAPDARVVVVSGYAADRLGEARDHGAVGFVQKGLSPRRMVDEVLAIAGVLDVVQGSIAASHRTLEATLASGAEVRRFMEETLRRWSCVDVLDIVNLLVSELVTNAVMHGGSEADVSVVLTPTALRVEVADQDETMPELRESVDAWDTSGRGLAFVESMSEAWGVRRTPSGKAIWFEVARPDR
jgi:DNA-binding NarL/FixJ family response regulator